MTFSNSNPLHPAVDDAQAGGVLPPPGSAGLPSGRSVPEWIAKHPDQTIPGSVRSRVFLRFSGRCAECTRKLRPGHYEMDHTIALTNGGGHRESNLRPLCLDPCHTDKTRADIKQKAKAERVFRKHFGVKLRRAKLRSAAMEGRG